MPEFKPFRGIRPVKEIAGFFSTKSIDSFTLEELEKETAQNADSFLQIIKPTWEKANEDPEVRLKEIAENFQNFVKSSHSEQDKTSFYIYQLTKPDKEQVRGIIGLVNLEDYKAGKIKKHEETLTKRVELFANYLKNVHFHSEPVLLTYPHNQRIDLLMEVEMKKLAAASFTDKDENLHQLWQIVNRFKLQQMQVSIKK